MSALRLSGEVLVPHFDQILRIDQALLLFERSIHPFEAIKNVFFQPIVIRLVQRLKLVKRLP